MTTTTPIEIQINASANGQGAVDGMSESVDRLGRESEQTGQQSEEAAKSIKEQSKAINSERESIDSLLKLQRSENDLVRERIKTRQVEQEAIRDAAKARGDEAAAIRATNTLKEIEAAKLQLAAQQKRQEIHAAEALLATKQKELALTGVINQNDQRALQASQNKIAAMRQEAASLDAAADAARANQKAASGVAGENEKLGASSFNAAGALTALGGVVASVFAQQFVQALINTENLAMGLNAVAQNSKVAGEQLDFVKRMSAAAGVDVMETGRAFLSLQASTKGTAVEGKITSDVFEAVTVSMAKAGKTSAETSLALQALGQMAGKGVVSMEELRGQLGEALPGAMQAAAKGLGVTVQDLTKLVEEGKIAAEDIFPALTSGLKDLYGTAPDAQTLSAEITNLKNTFVEMLANLGEATGAGGAFKAILESLQGALLGLEHTIIFTGKELGIFLSALANMDFSNFSQAISDVEKEAKQKIYRMAEHNTVLQKNLGITAEQAREMSKSLREGAGATEQAGAAAAKSVEGYVALSNAYIKVNEEIKDGIELASREVALAKATGDASVARARVLGDEKVIRQAIADAAKAEAVALTDLAEKKQVGVEVLKAELANKQALLNQAGPLSDAKKKEIKDLGDLVAKKQVEAATTAQQAAAADEHARAVSMERTALQLATAAAQQSLEIKKVEANASLLGLETQLKLAQSSEDLARVMGNESGVRKAKIQQMEIEIQITKAKADVQEVEARGTIAVARAKIDELMATNQLTPLKAAELNASIKLAEAKIAEAKAIGQSTAASEKLLEGLKNGTKGFDDIGRSSKNAATQIMGFGVAAASGMDQFAASIDRAMTGMQRLEAQREAAHKREIERQKAEDAAWDKRLGRDAEKFSLGPNGQRVSASVETVDSVLQKLMQMGVSQDKAAEIAPALARQWQSMATGTGGKLLGTFTQVGTTKSWEQILAEAASGAKNELGSTRIVNVNLTLGGKTVNAAIPASQEKSFLDMLTADKRVSS